MNVEATTDAIDYRQVEPALQRCKEQLGTLPKQLVADGDYTNHQSVQAAATSGVDFYGSWQDSWKPSEQDALGRSGRFISSAFPYDAVRNVFLCPAGKELTLQIITNEENGVRRHVYKAPKAACRTCALRDQCGPKNKRPEWRRAVTRNEEPPASIAFKAKMQTEAAQHIQCKTDTRAAVFSESVRRQNGPGIKTAGRGPSHLLHARGCTNCARIDVGDESGCAGSHSGRR